MRKQCMDTSSPREKGLGTLAKTQRNWQTLFKKKLTDEILLLIAIQWTLANPDPVSPNPRKSEVQGTKLKRYFWHDFGSKVHVMRMRIK